MPLPNETAIPFSCLKKHVCCRVTSIHATSNPIFLFNEESIRKDRVNGFIKTVGYNGIYGDSRFPYRESKSLYFRPHKALDYFHSGCRLIMVSCVIPKPASASLIDCSIRSFFSDLSIFYFFFYSR